MHNEGYSVGHEQSMLVADTRGVETSVVVPGAPYRMKVTRGKESRLGSMRVL